MIRSIGAVRFKSKKYNKETIEKPIIDIIAGIFIELYSFFCRNPIIKMIKPIGNKLHMNISINRGNQSGIK
tara:strand:+ start:779 stop:991 length:213 start_codon:yes stop_codon:yes gene_type:complete